MIYKLKGGELDLEEVLYVGKKVVVAQLPNGEVAVFFRENEESELDRVQMTMGMKMNQRDKFWYKDIPYMRMEDINGKKEG